jgi:hypothetical protein
MEEALRLQAEVSMHDALNCSESKTMTGSSMGSMCLGQTIG